MHPINLGGIVRSREYRDIICPKLRGIVELVPTTKNHHHHNHHRHDDDDSDDYANNDEDDDDYADGGC